MRAIFSMLGNLSFALGVFGLLVMIIILAAIVGSFFLLSGILEMIF